MYNEDCLEETANVLLAWILDKNTNEMRLISLYIDEK